MKLSNFIAGLLILETYYDEEYVLGADHDVIYAYPTQRPVSEEDVSVLRTLGWFQDEVDDEDPYDPYESWAAFV